MKTSYEYQDCYKLASYFVHNFIQINENKEVHISRAIQSIHNLIEKGWTVEGIKETLDQFAKEYPNLLSNIRIIEEIMSNKQPPDNLMDPDVFYYHNELRITSKPPKLKFDKKTKKYIRKEEPFFLEMKPVYTMQDLLRYWYKSNKTFADERMMKRDKGRFQYLLDYYDLDELLFMIDLAQADRKEKNIKPLKNIFHLEPYIEEAKKAIERKRSISRMQGIDEIIKRKESLYEQ